MAEEPAGRLIFGRNAVLEALSADGVIDTVYVSVRSSDPFCHKLRAMARERGAVVKQVTAEKLDHLCGGVHQGVVATAAVFHYADLDDLFARASARGEPPFLVILDGIEDPHNLGAIIRTAECAGAHGVIIGKHRACAVTPTVQKVSAGATEHMAVARVNNIADAIERIKSRGVFVYGADMRGEPRRRHDLGGPIALCIGGEGSGLGRLVRERCDALISLPLCGKIESLNASVAAGILLYAITDARAV